MSTSLRFRVIAFVAILAGLVYPCRAVAQGEKPWVFPSDLRPRLESRLHQFTQAQADGRWDDVAVLLGAYRRGFNYLPYTPAHKACLISEMQTSPMIVFTFTLREYPYSTEILSTPAGRRWWILAGEGTFQEASGLVKRQASVTAYRDRGDWYFTPNYLDDDAWARLHLTAEQLAADLKDRVDLILAPDCPLDIVDFHVFINPKSLSSRQIEFRLRNKTDKPVKGYCFEISDEKRDGSISVGTGAPRDAIEARGLSRTWKEDYSLYLYWCQGETRMHIEIQAVYFSNGLTWNAPGFPSHRK